MVASRLARPVSELATASAELASGDFEAPLPTSRVEEVETVSRAFAHMREALAARIGDLRDANQALEERQRRLQALQAEIIQRDRLVAAGRLVTELAHEIRNPVANVRNCLEVVRRRTDDTKAQEFTELAIAELLRMHELAEQMLDLNRPSDPSAQACDARKVIQQVATLSTISKHAERWPVHIEGPEAVRVAVPPDTLKQVLLTVLVNARDASPEGGAVDVRIDPPREGAPAAVQESRDGRTDGAEDPGLVSIEISDRGQGIPDDVLANVFDPFFTTKDEVHGVGLGLFIAQGALRRHGGQMYARNRSPGPGATIRIELPSAMADTDR
jgi:two-component system NtrC family sensor kinase